MMGWVVVVVFVDVLDVMCVCVCVRERCGAFNLFGSRGTRNYIKGVVQCCPTRGNIERVRGGNAGGQ